MDPVRITQYCPFSLNYWIASDSQSMRIEKEYE